jgi:type II secretory ATPase GspE/PulE/Tfp pilus assembly ATPase PilB-like protein
MTAVVAPSVPLVNMALTPRRKIYATSEERKQRNRQAQAAFRERRTEYIKQLESTIKHHEETLQNLQNSHRNAADECLMLRYKNSLLERILLEKGTDAHTTNNHLVLMLTGCVRHRRPG